MNSKLLAVVVDYKVNYTTKEIYPKAQTEDSDRTLYKSTNDCTDDALGTQ